MGMWMDEPAPGDFLDDRNPLAMPDVDDELLEPAVSGGDWSPADGYPDGTMSLRVWVDEAGRLTKVAISNRWRERSKGASLTDLFEQAFSLANARVGVRLVEPGLPEVESTSEELSWDSLDDLLELSFQLDDEARRLDRLPEEQVKQSTWVGTPAEGHSENGMVTVRLTLSGVTERVEFNRKWLDGTRVSELMDAVVQAHEQAYAAYVPPTFAPGDRARLAAGHRRIRNQVVALMRGAQEGIR